MTAASPLPVVAGPVPDALGELQSAYDAYKRLVTVYAAAILHGRPDSDRVADATALSDRVRGVVPHVADADLRAALETCVAALDHLARPDALGAEGATGLRDHHRALREAAWRHLEFEYVPCSAEDLAPHRLRPEPTTPHPAGTETDHG